MLEIQTRFADTVTYGYTMDPTGIPIYSHLYFAGLRLLAHLVMLGAWSAELRRALAKDLGVRPFEPKWTSRARVVEHLDVAQRLRVMVLTQSLLNQWPKRFVNVARSLGLTASDIVGKATRVPYWLASAVDDHLFVGAYSPAPAEIRQAIAHLRRQGHSVTKANVSRALGVTDPLRKRQLEFLLKE